LPNDWIAKRLDANRVPRRVGVVPARPECRSDDPCFPADRFRLIAQP
jgi:hypothetical protein